MLPGKTDFFNYDWRNGSWNLVLMLGIVIGGFIGATWLGNPDPVAISEATRSDLALLGVTNFNGLLPADIYSWEGLGTLRGLILLVGGGFLIGFGTRWAGGCTSGHAISGLADLQLPSLIAVIGFFAGGLIATFLLLPIIL